MLQGIKGCALCRQDAARIALNHGQNVFCLDGVAVFAVLCDFGIRDQFTKTIQRNIKPGDDDILAGFKRDTQARIFGHDIIRCDVTGADVFGKGAVDEF